MTAPGGLSAGLAYLPNWLDADAALDTLLSGWVRACGWRAAGLGWPVDPLPGLARVAGPNGVEKVPPPAELPQVVRSLRAGAATVDGASGRLYALMTPTGRAPGVVWAERGADAWTDTDRNYLRVAARLIERSPALGSLVGPALDADRLQQRLDDAAVIAGRMAHDFDNILTGIIGFADLSVPLLPAGSQAAKFVAEISKVGHRGIQFTQQLHQLSRSGQSRPQAGSVGAALAKEEARLRPALAAGVELSVDVPPALGMVGLDDAALRVVLGHLLENAADATPPGGRITVTARVVELAPADAKGYLGQVGPGPHIEIAVQDSGPGIKPEVRSRLFADPFVTTKARRRGLGLAVVYRTAHAHRGGVRLDPAPAPGPGPVARVVLPPAAARPVAATAAFAGTTSSSLGG